MTYVYFLFFEVAKIIFNIYDDAKEMNISKAAFEING